MTNPSTVLEIKYSESYNNANNSTSVNWLHAFSKMRRQIFPFAGPRHKDKSWMAYIAIYKYILTSALDRGDRTSGFGRFIPVK